eukprot:scaffold10206_cov216-Ochromonas_danica.AAC.1
MRMARRKLMEAKGILLLAVHQELFLHLPPHVRQGRSPQELHALLLHQDHHGQRAGAWRQSWLSLQAFLRRPASESPLRDEDRHDGGEGD